MAFYQSLTRAFLTKGLKNYVKNTSIINRSIGQNRQSAAVLWRNVSTNLPRLPVPTLKQTIDKFLATVRPFVTEEEYKTTRHVAETFVTRDAPSLQAHLVEKAKHSENWLADWWLNSAYLEFRSPVVVYSSPGLVFPKQKFSDVGEKLTFAANMIVGCVDYKMKVDSDKIPVDMMGKVPLDMSQYKKVFGTCRVPGAKRDSIEFHPKSKHIVVVCNNNYFKIDVIGSDCQLVNVDQIFEQLYSIYELSSKEGIPIGILTADNRDNWAEAYKCLISDELNRSCVKDIQSSLFVVCLDKSLPNTKRTNCLTLASDQLIHGGGSRCNAGNRWYDKTIQLIISDDGINGFTYEHSPAEGQPIAVVTDYIIDYTKERKGKDLAEAKYAPTIKHLKFNMVPGLKEFIDRASDTVDKMACDLDTLGYQFKHFGKDGIKRFKLSPDSFIQIAMQYAFFKLHKVPGAHYESGATRKYLHGRTETIRSCSCESVMFAQTMLNKDSSDYDKADALKAAIDSHKKYTMEACNGFGVDRHLLGLKLAALEKGLAVSPLYHDPGYTRSAHMRISTSQVAVKCDGFMVYGPLVTDGYACCYNPRKDDINFGITTHNSDSNTSSLSFKDCLEECMLDMQGVLMRTAKSKL